MSPLDNLNLWIWLPPCNSSKHTDKISGTCWQMSSDSANLSPRWTGSRSLICKWKNYFKRTHFSSNSRRTSVFSWFLVLLVLFLLLRVCEGGRRKHGYGGNGSYLMGNHTYHQMRTRPVVLGKEEDFIAKGKSKLHTNVN